MPELRPNIRDALRKFADLVARLREAVGRADPATALEQIVVVTGYDAYLADEGPEGVERLENVRELIAGAAEWAEVQTVVEPSDSQLATTRNAQRATQQEGEEEEEEEGSLIQRYLTQAALITPQDQGEEGADVVTLLTVHMAKGLEWPVVALAGLEDGLFPLGRSTGQPGGLEEERRLCYVGLTRAREKLYLSWARTRYRGGRLELSEPSRFLEALPPDVVEQRDRRRVWERAGARPRAAGNVQRLDAPVEFPEEMSQDALRYVQGERVRHRKFGGGVVRATSGSGRDLKVTVEFDDQDVGTKQLLVVYAGLERDWESE